MTEAEKFEEAEGDDQKVHEGTETTLVDEDDLVDVDEPQAPASTEGQVKYDGGPIPRK